MVDFLSLIYPEVCEACGNPLVKQEEVLCTFCLHELPYTHFHNDPSNETARQFWGKVPVTAATSMLYFRKSGKVQHLLHSLKYKGVTRVGYYLGLLYGNQLRDIPGFGSCQLICPVPLHRSRYRQRGYNQSACFALGLSESMEIPGSLRLLRCIKAARSQTGKSRYQRYENVHDIFRVQDPGLVRDRHILLVDDVCTTGSTLTACAETLLAAGTTRISIATIAYSLR